MKTKGKSNKGITLIALVITIIVLIILAGISISLVLGQNGLFNKARSASVETKKARFVEDAGFAYSEIYIEKVETSNANYITIGDVVSKLKSSYGYTEEQIKAITSEVSGITLSETEVTLVPGETKDIIVTLENGNYYALIEGLYYPITLSNGEITLGNGIASLPEGDGTASTITATATIGSELVEVIVNGTTITIKAKDGKAGEATITVTCGNITKTIIVTIKDEIKQGDEVLGPINVIVNGKEQKLEQGWKYFCEDGEKVWLIYSKIMERTVLQQVGETIKKDDNNRVYSSKNRQDLLDYLNGVGTYETVWNHIKIGIKDAISDKGIKIDDNKLEVKGTPDVQLWQKAYNDMYPSEMFEVQGNDTSGWMFRLGGEGNFALSINFKNKDKKPLFFGQDYWLASIPTDQVNALCSIKMNVNTCYNYYTIINNGVRPVVSIPRAVFDQLVGN